MSRVNRSNLPVIGGVQSSRLGQTDFNLPKQISFHENFHFPDYEEIELPRNKSNNIITEDIPYRKVCRKLFVNILRNGIAIVASNPRKYKDYIVEASLVIPKEKGQRPFMKLPLPGISSVDKLDRVDFVEKWLDTIFISSGNCDLLRIIVVTAHEYGHFLSYQHGNHDKDLEIGIEMLNQRRVNSDFSYLWAVLREECLAWRFGLHELEYYGFNDFQLFKKVRKESLKTYFDVLNISNAPTDIYYKLFYYAEELGL